MKTFRMYMSLGSMLLALIGCSTTKKVAEGKVASGPFEIGWEVESSRSTAWFNNGGSSDTRNLTSYFSVYHQGKLIEIPSDNEKRQYFWQALFLTGSERPAVLAGVHSMYLLTEQAGQPLVTPLDEQAGGFASYQWLDSQTGQPGPQQTVNLGDVSQQNRFLTGGRYLLINGRVVLDVKTLQVYPFKRNQFRQAQMRGEGGYNASGSSLLEVSPSGEQLVFWGSRSNENEVALFEEYALVVVDYKTNRRYEVPFDRTQTHFYSSWEATPTWIKTYFEWVKDKEGRDHLQKRVLTDPPPWQGRYRYDEFTGQLSDYRLMPVKFSMMEQVVSFLQAHYRVTDLQRQERQYGTTRFTLTVNGTPIYLSFLHELQSAGEDQCVAVHGGEGSSPLLQSIGKGFDAAMRAGQYQQEYTEFKDWNLKRN